MSVVENGICKECGRDYNDDDPKYHIDEAKECPSEDCPSNEEAR